MGPQPPQVGRPLRSHLESHYGIEIAALSALDQGVFRVDRHDGPSWVARVFPPRRHMDVVAGDADVLRFLADCDFPAERCAAHEPVSIFDGNSVLVTDHIDEVPRQERRAAIREAGGLRRLGDLLGRLHVMPEGPAPLDRPGGAWHHLTDGTPHDEIVAATTQFAEAGGGVSAAQRELYDSMRAELDTLEDCEGLPDGLLHPDYVLANVVASPDRGMVIVDWAGAGRGPRLWSLAWFLFAEGARGLPRVDRVMEGYRRHVELEPEELARLVAVTRVRWVVLKSWEFCMRGTSLAEMKKEVAEARELAEAVGSRVQRLFAPKGSA